MQSINESKELWTEITPPNVSVKWSLDERADTNINSDEFQDVFNNLYVNAMNSYNFKVAEPIQLLIVNRFSI